MRLIFLGLAMLLAPAPAMAQQWYRVAGDEISQTFVDLDSIKPEGDRTMATEMVLYRTHFRDTEVKHMVTHSEFDCPARRAHFLRVEFFGDDRGELGAVDDPDEGGYRSVRPGSPAESTLNFVCGVDRDGAVAVADPWADPS